MNLDIGLIQKFGRLNITAPTEKGDLPRTLQDLEELKLAFLQKGDEEREKAKAKFLREVRRGKPDESSNQEEEKVPTSE